MSVADNFKAYPAAATEPVWKAAKTEKLRDKWNTELGTALVVAERNYKAIKPELIDVQRIKAKSKAEFASLADLEKARKKAVDHYDRIVRAAIASLENARSKAAAAGRNIIISKGSKAKAKEIAAALAEPLQVLKAIHLRDFDAEKERMEKA